MRDGMVVLMEFKMRTLSVFFGDKIYKSFKKEIPCVIYVGFQGQLAISARAESKRWMDGWMDGSWLVAQNWHCYHCVSVSDKCQGSGPVAAVIEAAAAAAAKGGGGPASGPL